MSRFRAQACDGRCGRVRSVAAFRVVGAGARDTVCRFCRDGEAIERANVTHHVERHRQRRIKGLTRTLTSLQRRIQDLQRHEAIVQGRITAVRCTVQP